MTGLLLRAALFAVLALAALYENEIASTLFADPAGGVATAFSLTVRSLTWLAGALLAISALERFFWNGAVARLTRHPVPALLKSVVALIILVVTATCIISFVFKRDVTAIWATSGVLGLVLGFALRNMIQDIFTGIALNLDGSIREGDWIALHHRDFMAEQYGKMLDIGWRVCRMQLENNNVVVIPNGMLGMMAITNFAHSDHVSRMQTEIVIDFDVPPDRARRILLAGARAAATEKGILDHPEPTVLIGEPADHGVCYIIRFWGKVDERSPSALRDAVMAHLLRQLHIAGLTPALPKEDVFLDRRPKRLLDHGGEDDRIEILSRIDLFSGALERDELAGMARAAKLREFPAGEALVRQGEDGTSLYVVAEGILDVHIDGPDGTAVKVGHVLAGEIFGEMSLLTGAPRSASVTAATGVVVFEVTRDQFEAVLNDRPEIAGEISRLVARRQAATVGAANADEPADIEREERLLRQRILDNMAKVFSGLRGKAAQSQSAARA
ncbi:mechanosensitive ion channel family protein [Oricola indica]|jgi:CRP-like cAMP-binding protein/small-conductance mechanosensitive channel|uniref:mechanosensitive ion channel family protein n=1 Tax=Oricola indica TaxID=2872591 RepID=UPI001CBC80A2|nr:mechanosensitive ion channel family protein [Oricola indica]